MNSLQQYLTDHALRFEEQLCELLRIPSVSADSQYEEDVRRGGEWVGRHLRNLGLEAELIETPGHPVVFAQTPPRPGLPTVLVYGHYDVQPPDPLNLWTTPAFEPTRRDGNLYARGATDDKGQLFTHLASTEAHLAVHGQTPVNLKFLIEGEEEIGSRHLDEFIEAHRELLAADVAVISDTSQLGPGQPAITYGLRGITYYELRLEGPRQDLHSGSFGGAVTNPALALAQILAGLRDSAGRVTLPGFYDAVEPLGEEERRELAELPFDEREFYKSLGVPGGTGEEGYTPLERRWARPSYDVCGLWGGYQGEGAKTVLPAQAGAKLSFRLVPRQDPQQVTAALRQRVGELCPPGIRFDLTAYHGAPGVVVDRNSPYLAAARRAIAVGFGTEPVLIREGGSIPVVSTFHEKLGIDTLLLGWGLPDDNAHSPNEKFNLADFHRGIRASAQLWTELAAGH